MKKFIYKIGIFLVIFLASMLCFVMFDYLVIGNQYTKSYQASLVDKVERLREKKESKIILVGNSNVAFGIDSEKIEEAFGRPVVNLGLHGGLGNAFHEEIAKQNITEKDIVIVCHTNFSDDGRITETDLAWTTMEYHKELWPIIQKEEYWSMIKAYPQYMMQTGLLWISGRGNRNETDTCYSRLAFNSYGDVVVRPEKKRIETSELFFEGSIVVPEINDTCINRMNEYNQYILSQGATLLVAGYPIAWGEYTPKKEEYEAFEKELREKLDCDVISKYTDYFIPYQYFYNTTLHLTKEGAKIRTELLIRDLEKWMQKRGME